MDDRYDNVLLVVVPDKYTQPRITGYNNSRALIIRTWQICPHPPPSLPSALGMPSFQKSAVFLNIVQKAFDPPPFI